MRYRKTTATFLAGLLALLGSIVFTPSAMAAPAGMRTLTIGYEHANYGGSAFEVYVTDKGDCDAGGYTREIGSNDWKGRISSFKIPPGSYCSMINVWRKTSWNTNSGQICYSGQLPVSNLHNYSNCGDNVWGVTVYKGPRRG